MSFRYKIFHDRKLVYVTATRKPTFDEQLQHFDLLAREPGYVSPMKKLVDLRKTGQIGLSNLEITRMVEKLAAYKEKFKDEQTAVVVSNDLDFGLSRMFSANMEPYGMDLNVFRTIEAALRCLDVKLDESEMVFD